MMGILVLNYEKRRPSPALSNTTNKKIKDLVDELGNQVASNDFVPGESCDFCRFVVPLVHLTVSIDAEDRRVGCVNECLVTSTHQKIGTQHRAAISIPLHRT
jgi:hypothetical protein